MCKATAGFKDVDIIWRTLVQKNSSSLVNYRTFYCTADLDCKSPPNEQYQLGCTLNTTQHSLQKELQCRITKESLFPNQFYFIVELRNSSGVFISRKKTCRLVAKGKCSIFLRKIV